MRISTCQARGTGRRRCGLRALWRMTSFAAGFPAYSGGWWLCDDHVHTELDLEIKRIRANAGNMYPEDWIIELRRMRHSGLELVASIKPRIDQWPAHG